MSDLAISVLSHEELVFLDALLGWLLIGKEVAPQVLVRNAEFRSLSIKVQKALGEMQPEGAR